MHLSKLQQKLFHTVEKKICSSVSARAALHFLLFRPQLGMIH